MQVVFNVLVVVGSSIEKVDPGFCLLSLAGRRQPAAPPPVAVRQSSGRPPVQPAMCVGGGPQPAACAKKVWNPAIFWQPARKWVHFLGRVTFELLELSTVGDSHKNKPPLKA
jgi:hypothetical protein